MILKKTLLIGAACLVVSCGQSGSKSGDSEPVAPETQMSEVNLVEGAWSAQQSSEILDKTLRIKLGYDTSGLTPNEIEAADQLLLAGIRLHSMYLEQRHPQARAAQAVMAESGRADQQALFRIFKGPIGVTLDNSTQAFIGVEPLTAARNVYPVGVEKSELEAFITANPDRKDELLHLRSVVKIANEAEKSAALATLAARPALETLHPGIRDYISSATGYFALPYSLAYADDIFYVYDRLYTAAAHIEGEDIAFARFLRLRARDLLADDYDGSDAAWVSSQFTGNLNAQIGSYETYDDAMFGVKSFFSLSLLKRDIPQSESLAAATKDIQAIENNLPYSANKQLRSNIPVGVYDVIADFGQARGTNTATILPNEGHLSRQYGRTILIRSNILTNPEIFTEAQRSFKAALAPAHHGDLAPQGNFYRTLWHEMGHYMGPDQTKSGGDIDAALQDTASLIEEMKADLVSLFAARNLSRNGSFTQEDLRGIYASGVLRVLLKNQPRRSQSYATMQLIQWNWFMNQGVLRFEDGVLSINYRRFPRAVEGLLRTVLDLQYQGDIEATNAFVDKWTGWDEQLHGVIAANMKAAEGSRYRLVTYEALGE